jgi:hypothetical protein
MTCSDWPTQNGGAAHRQPPTGAQERVTSSKQAPQQLQVVDRWRRGDLEQGEPGVRGSMPLLGATCQLERLGKGGEAAPRMRRGGATQMGQPTGPLRQQDQRPGKG